LQAGSGFSSALSKTKDVISSTLAHSDFVKTLLIVPSLQLLVSGSSDKSVRFWSVALQNLFSNVVHLLNVGCHEHNFRDLSSPRSSDGLPSVGSISSHTRPVESLAAYIDTTTSPPHLVLFTADTMGVIKVWDVVKDSAEGPPIWRSTLRDELKDHRTGVNEIVYGDGHLWSGKNL